MRLIEVEDKSGSKFRLNTAQIIHIQELAADEHKITFSHSDTHLYVDKANLFRIEVGFRQEGHVLEKPAGSAG